MQWGVRHAMACEWSQNELRERNYYITFGWGIFSFVLFGSSEFDLISVVA